MKRKKALCVNVSISCIQRRGRLRSSRICIYTTQHTHTYRPSTVKPCINQLRVTEDTKVYATMLCTQLQWCLLSQTDKEDMQV